MPASPLYNMAVAFRIQGPLDPVLFGQAFQSFLARCDAARTVFGECDGLPFQRVLNSLDYPLLVEDLSTHPHELDELILQLTAKPFDLSVRLIRSRLIRLSSQEHVWFLNQHHLITDATSTALTYQEVSDHYQRLQEGRELPTRSLPSYRDHIRWEQEDATITTRVSHLEFWKSQSVPPPLRLYGRRSSSGSTKATRVTHVLDREQVNALNHLVDHPEIESFTRDLTFFSIFSTALLAWLGRISGERDLSLGTFSRNRPTPTSQKTIGLFIEMFPLRVELEDDDTFLSLLKKVQATNANVLRHAFPGASSPALNRPVVAAINFVTARFASFAGLETTTSLIFPQHSDSGHYVRLQVLDFGKSGEFALSFDLNDEVFPKEEQRTRALGHFGKLLDAFAADPECQIATVNLLSQPEQTELVQGDQSLSPQQAPTTVLDLIEAQIRLAPQAIAVRQDQRTVSFEDLAARISAVAAALQQQGIGPGDVVAVLLPRSIESVLSFLGILKSGAAYLPLSPNDPPERIRYALEDSRSSAVITLDERTDLPVPVITIGEALKSSNALTPTSISPSDVAYVIYTSGSTGSPKGVVIEHSSLLNYTSWAAHVYCQNKPGRFPLFTPLTFDLTVTSLYVPLLCGGEIVVYPECNSQADLSLIDVISDDAVDIIKLTPSHLEMLRGQDLSRSRVRALILGGENLMRDTVLALTADFKRSITIYNEYGPTEATVGCMIHTFDAGRDHSPSVPIGVPAAGSRIYLLDHHLQPVPHGVTGEIYVAGPGLAREYLNRPDITAECFLDSPFGPEDRLYRTGDLARMDENGHLLYLGRQDEQVKFRGVRVELSELETNLSLHPDITAGALSLRGEAPRTQLVAYYVAARPLGPREAQAHLAQHLPQQMLPSHYVQLDEMPLSKNGKLNRLALPAPGLGNTISDSEFEPPRNKEEAILCEIWSRVLRLEQVGIHDNLLEIGGDSISAIQIVSQAAESGLRLTPGDLLSQQTIASIAPLVGESEIVEAEQGLVTGPTPLPPILLWYFELDLPEPDRWNHTLALRLPRSTSTNQVIAALTTVGIHHDILRTKATSQGGIRTLEILPDLEPPLVIAGDRAAAESLLKQAKEHICLERGCLISAVLLSGSNDERELHLVVHHLAVDAVSWPILLADLGRAFQSEPIPGKTTSFQEWSNKLPEAAHHCEGALPFWIAQHPPASEIDSVPGPRSVPPQAVSEKLSEAETEQLLVELPKQRRIQPHELLLTAFLVTLRSWNGRAEQQLLLEGHGREQLADASDLSRTMGWFTSIFPLSFDLRDERDSGRLVGIVKDAFASLPHRGASYGLLRYLHSDDTVRRQLAELPSPRILFNYLGDSEQLLPSPSPFALSRSLTLDRGDINGPAHALELNSMIVDGELQMEWTYATQSFENDEIEEQARALTNRLRQFLGEILSGERRRYAAEFPQANLSEDKLSGLTKALDRLK